MKRHLILVVLFIVAIVFAGCRTRKTSASVATPTPAKPPFETIGGNWVLEKLNGHVLEAAGYENEKPRIEVQQQNNMYFGYTGCNNMNGEIVLTQTSIQFKPGPMTRRACMDGNNIETDFLKALSAATLYTINNSVLELKNSDNTVVCVFRRQ